MNDKMIVISRSDLFEKVWSVPVSRLASEYGLSDVGLAKICRRMEIPRPERGYWQKLEVGRAPPKPELKPLSNKGVNKVVVNPNLSGTRARFPGVKIEKILCPGILKEPHALTGKTLRALETGKKDDRGVLRPRNKIYLDIRITRDSIARACLIMDTLVKALEDREFQVSVVKDDPARTIVSVDGEAIEIGIDEKIRAIDHVPTPEGKLKHANYPWMLPRYDYLPTGSLALKIRNANWLGVRQTWGDGKVQRLEDCIGSFMSGLHQAAQALKEQRLEEERRKLEWAEADRRRKERERLDRIEKEKVEKLSKDVQNWQAAENIRHYLEAVEKLEDEIEGLGDWIEWISSYAEKIDPLKNPENLVFKINENKWWY